MPNVENIRLVDPLVIPNVNIPIRPDLPINTNVDNPARPASPARVGWSTESTFQCDEIRCRCLSRVSIKKRKFYPHWVDSVSCLKRVKTLDFTIFTGEDEQSTIEHIGQILVQCGEAGTNKFLRL